MAAGPVWDLGCCKRYKVNESKSVAAILRPRELGGPFEMSIRFEHGRIRQMMVSETSSSTPGMRASDEDDCILRSIDC